MLQLLSTMYFQYCQFDMLIIELDACIYLHLYTNYPIMKIYLTICFICVFTICAIAQKPVKQIPNKNDDVYADSTENIINFPKNNEISKPLQLIDGQILGPGLFFSVNYDTRFKPINNGLGLRLGLGYAIGATIPLSINYLIGKNNKRSFLELGAGVTIYIPSGGDLNLYQQLTVLPNTYIMYRYQALKSPNTFRIGLSQIIMAKDIGFVPYYPSLSLGHILGRRK